MQLCAVDESELVESGVLTGSMAMSYQDRLIRVHAVRLTDGRPAEDRAVCGFRYVSSRLGEVLPAWEAVYVGVRCRACAEEFGEAAVIAGR